MNIEDVKKQAERILRDDSGVYAEDIDLAFKRVQRDIQYKIYHNRKLDGERRFSVLRGRGEIELSKLSAVEVYSVHLNGREIEKVRQSLEGVISGWFIFAGKLFYAVREAGEVRVVGRFLGGLEDLGENMLDVVVDGVCSYVFRDALQDDAAAAKYQQSYVAGLAMEDSMRQSERATGRARPYVF